jgi:hypothetical protein
MGRLPQGHPLPSVASRGLTVHTMRSEHFSGNSPSITV